MARNSTTKLRGGKEDALRMGVPEKEMVSPEYRAWQKIINRSPSMVCLEWKENYFNFLSDVGRRPTDGWYCLYRRDINGPYDKNNCCWMLQSDVNRNKKQRSDIQVRLLTYNGRTQTICQWARELGVNHNTLRYRLYYGWTVERTLGRPVKRGFAAERGERISTMKLSNDDVRTIRKSPLQSRILAEMYGVTPAVIRGVKRRRAYGRVT